MRAKGISKQLLTGNFHLALIHVYW